MKKTMYMAIPIIALLVGTGLVNAQMMQGNRNMMKEQIQQQSASSQYYHDDEHMMYPGMMGGYGMGYGMMGRYGMGPGMMGCGTGYGMMGGYGMGPGMMGGYGPGYMHGKRGMHRYRSTDDFDTFLDETRELRKKMHDLRFEYGEMMRRPATTIGDLKKMQQQMYELQEQILEKAAE